METETRASLVHTQRTALKRHRERGTYDRDALQSILNEAMVCHVGTADQGSVYVVPMAFATIGDDLYVHGAAANHLLAMLASGADACITVTLLDGLVLARSAFHHSMNYRCAMLFGQGVRVDDAEEKLTAMNAIVEHLTPGRSNDARPPTENELRATTVVRFPIAEGSVKIRSGPPLDDDGDLGLAVWAGVLPLSTVVGAPITDGAGHDGLEVPTYVSDYEVLGRRTSLRAR